MLDVIFIALVLVFFGIAFWYVRFCVEISFGMSITSFNAKLAKNRKARKAFSQNRNL